MPAGARRVNATKAQHDLLHRSLEGVSGRDIRRQADGATTHVMRCRISFEAVA